VWTGRSTGLGRSCTRSTARDTRARQPECSPMQTIAGATDMQAVNRPNARFLMCRPEHFAVSYAINPWMDPESWTRDERARFAAAREWRALHAILLELDASIELVPPAPRLPDLVFTANAGVVLDRQVLLA